MRCWESQRSCDQVGSTCTMYAYLMLLTQFIPVESLAMLQYTSEQKTQNTNWGFQEKKTMFFWGFMLFLLMVLTSDTIYLSLIACHALLANTQKTNGFLGFSCFFLQRALQVMLLD